MSAPNYSCWDVEWSIASTKKTRVCVVQIRRARRMATWPQKCEPVSYKESSIFFITEDSLTGGVAYIFHGCFFYSNSARLAVSLLFRRKLTIPFDDRSRVLAVQTETLLCSVLEWILCSRNMHWVCIATRWNQVTPFNVYRHWGQIVMEWACSYHTF